MKRNNMEEKNDLESVVVAHYIPGEKEVSPEALTEIVKAMVKSEEFQTFLQSRDEKGEVQIRISAPARKEMPTELTEELKLDYAKFAARSVLVNANILHPALMDELKTIFQNYPSDLICLCDSKLEDLDNDATKRIEDGIAHVMHAQLWSDHSLVEILRESLVLLARASNTFTLYSRIHADKFTDEGMEKSKSNSEKAERLKEFVLWACNCAGIPKSTMDVYFNKEHEDYVMETL